MTGVISFDCFDERFQQLQKHIVNLQPMAFEDIEGALT